MEVQTKIGRLVLGEKVPSLTYFDENTKFDGKSFKEISPDLRNVVASGDTVDVVIREIPGGGPLFYCTQMRMETALKEEDFCSNPHAVVLNIMGKLYTT